MNDNAKANLFLLAILGILAIACLGAVYVVFLSPINISAMQANAAAEIAGAVPTATPVITATATEQEVAEVLPTAQTIIIADATPIPFTARMFVLEDDVIREADSNEVMPYWATSFAMRDLAVLLAEYGIYNVDFVRDVEAQNASLVLGVQLTDEQLVEISEVIGGKEVWYVWFDGTVEQGGFQFPDELPEGGEFRRIHLYDRLVH